MTHRTTTIARWFALLWTVGLVGALLVLPVYDTMRTGTNGERALGVGTLLSVNGFGVLLVLLAPIAFTIMPLLPARAPRQRTLTIIAAALLAAFSLLGSASIGLFFLPSAVALAVAATPASNAPAT